MATRELTLTVNCAAVFESATLNTLPQLLAANPYGQVTELIDDSDGADGTEQAYSPEALIGVLRASKLWNVTLSNSSADARVIADLQQRARGVTISIKVVNERLAEEYESFVDYAVTWIEGLPKVSSGYIYDSSVDIASLHGRHNIVRPPACFTTHLRWMHFLAPSYYALFLTKEDLLNTPAYKVERMKDDIVVIRNFENPFAGGDPETLKRLAVISDYLKSKDHFMKT